MTEWMDGWMNEWIWRGCFRSPHYFDLLWLAKFFLFSTQLFLCPPRTVFFFFLSISLKNRIFSYIFFQWYVGKAPVNISIEVDNVHSWFGKKIQYLNLSQLLLDLALIWIFTSQIWKLLLCHQWSSRGNVRLYVYNGPKSPSFKCIS